LKAKDSFGNKVTEEIPGIYNNGSKPFLFAII